MAAGRCKIARDEQRGAALFLEISGQLGGGSGLAGAVEAHHEDAGRLLEIERGLVAAQERGQFILENFDDLLAGGDAAEHLLAQRLFLDAGDEVLRDGEIDVRLEQRHADLAQGVGDIRLADLRRDRGDP